MKCIFHNGKQSKGNLKRKGVIDTYCFCESDVDTLVNNGWDIPSHPTNTTKRRTYMLEALKFFTRYVLILSTIIGLVFMVVCTVFIITSVLHGDIKINIVRNKADKKNS